MARLFKAFLLFILVTGLAWGGTSISIDDLPSVKDSDVSNLLSLKPKQELVHDKAKALAKRLEYLNQKTLGLSNDPNLDSITQAKYAYLLEVESLALYMKIINLNRSELSDFEAKALEDAVINLYK